MNSAQLRIERIGGPGSVSRTASVVCGVALPVITVS